MCRHGQSPWFNASWPLGEQQPVSQRPILKVIGAVFGAIVPAIAWLIRWYEPALKSHHAKEHAGTGPQQRLLPVRFTHRQSGAKELTAHPASACVTPEIHKR